MKYIYLIAVLAFVTKAEFDPYNIGQSTASSASSAYSPEATPSSASAPPSSIDHPAQGASTQQVCRIRSSEPPAKDTSSNDSLKELGKESTKASDDIPTTDSHTPKGETSSSGGDTPSTDKYTGPGAPTSTDPLGDVSSSGGPGGYSPDQPAQKPSSQYCRIRKDSPSTSIGNEPQYKPKDPTESGQTKTENVYDEAEDPLAEDSYPTRGNDKPEKAPKDNSEDGSYKSKGSPHSYVKQPKQFNPYESNK